MKIVCPKCELKGQVDAAPAGAKSRIVCVRCANTFDAVFTDGQMEVLIPQDSAAKVSIDSAANGYLTAGTDLTVTPETFRKEHLNNSLGLEASPALEANSLDWSPDMMSKETGEPSPLAAQEEEDSKVFEESESGLGMQTQEMPGRSETSITASASLKANQTGKPGRPPSDASDVYGMGVRLMRVSPVWLLLAGLSCISFIVLCNWLVRPVEETGNAASLSAIANNHSTNASINRAAVTNLTAQSSLNNQLVQPKTESDVAFITTEAKNPPAPQQAIPDIKMIVDKPVVEQKPEAMPPSSTNSSDGMKEGKVTIQIGSYNEAGQAEERVVNLKAAGFEARSVAIEIPKRGTWYRVQSGRFINRDEAERYGKQLRDKGVVSSFITTDIQE